VEEVITEGVRKGSHKERANPLRASVLTDLSLLHKNTEDKTTAMMHWDYGQNSKIEIICAGHGG
tara:strand:- start:3472 stop:3663 length:192 start_codon:yes stop_codon:yes gene_type:complete